MSNKSLGNEFERELCKILAENGFWAYNTVNKACGQPADIIAAVNNRGFLIDAKVCSNNEFKTSRIEENQRNAMMKFWVCGNNECYFAMKLSDGTILMCNGIDTISNGKHRAALTEEFLRKYGTPIKEWMVSKTCG